MASNPKQRRKCDVDITSLDPSSKEPLLPIKSQAESVLPEEIVSSLNFIELGDDYRHLNSPLSQELNDSDVLESSTYENETKCRRNLFVKQATSDRNCFRYTGDSKQKLDLVFDLIKKKANSLRYWRGSVDTPPSNREKRGAQPRLLSC